MRRILVIGATGVFGRRLAAHLARLDGVELLLASRSPRRSEALVHALRGADDVAALLTPVALDHRHGLAEALARLAPWLAIDCSGPFQAMGYEVPRAALEAGAHVVDLADARGYLLGYGAALDALAKRKGLVALAGASSSPALASAALEALTEGWTRLDTVDIAITPGGRSEVGDAVIAAVLSYAGKPVPQWRDGRLAQAIGWAGSHVRVMPGLGPRRVAPVETADAELIAGRRAIASRVAFHAGLESPLEQWGLAALAWLRRRGLFRDAAALIGPLKLARPLTRLLTGDAGAMTVEAAGLDAEGRPTRAIWSLLALEGDGPNVPMLPAAAAVRALLAGVLPPGARPAAPELTLAAIEAEMAPYAIRTDREIARAPVEGLMRRALGQAYDALPAALRAFHDADAPPVWSGRADVEAAASRPARLVARVLGLPGNLRDAPVTVSVDRRWDGAVLRETWTRDFAGSRFRSVLLAEEDGRASERFGPLRFALDLQARGGTILFPVAGWRLGPLPLPSALAPRSEAREFVDAEGRFRFDVRMTLPLLGPLAHYRGWLTPAQAAVAAAPVSD